MTKTRSRTDILSEDTDQQMPESDVDHSQSDDGSAQDHSDMGDASAQTDFDAEDLDESDDEQSSSNSGERKSLWRRIKSIRSAPWAKITVYAVLPAIAFALGLGSGYLSWRDLTHQGAKRAGIEATQAAKDSVAAILTYKPDSVDKDLVAAESRLTGKFRDAYTQLIKDVVIPGSKNGNITAAATIPAAAVASATMNHAVVLVFVDQTTTVGTDPPSDTASSVRVTLDKVGKQWLISDFVPV